MLTTLTGAVHGRAADGLDAAIARLDSALQNDPDYSFQAAAFVNGECVLDVWGGPHLDGDSLMVPFSVTKNTIGFSVALLVERGEVDLDERVAAYWPEVAVAGKQDGTGPTLLPHRAGLPQAEPSLTWNELLDHHAAAERLARTRP